MHAYGVEIGCAVLSDLGIHAMKLEAWACVRDALMPPTFLF